MKEFTINVKGKTLHVKKISENYEITPYDENITKEDITDVLNKTGYYVLGISTVLPRKTEKRTPFINASKYYLVNLELKEKD